MFLPKSMVEASYRKVVFAHVVSCTVSILFILILAKPITSVMPHPGIWRAAIVVMGTILAVVSAARRVRLVQAIQTGRITYDEAVARHG